MTVGYEELELQIPGLRLAAKAWGPADGKPIVALHGWLDNANTYAALAPLLPEWRLIALDLPGHGKSAHRSADAVYHFIDNAAQVMEAACALGLTRFTLMGHSMGAGVATLVAGAFAPRIERLILLDGLGPLTAEPQQLPASLLAHTDEMTRKASKQPRPYVSVERMAETLAKIVPHMTLEGARHLVERGSSPVPGGFHWSYDARLRGTSPMRFTEAQAQAFLRAIACPVLFVRPVQGYPFGSDAVQARCACVPNMQVVEVPGGHHAHLVTPEPVAAVVRAFLGAP